MPDLLFFETIDDDSVSLVGGKGLSLGRMLRGKLPVPPGFVVATDAYRRLQSVGTAKDLTFRQIVSDAYKSIGSGLVAVRSSATAEDGAEASFAGQQETFLGIRGDENLLEAIEACWRSLHSERAAAYRKQRNITDDGLAMAVVVQELVPAEVAGVLFTRDPQNDAVMAVEASWGLGEAVVSGRVTPDRFRLDRFTGEVLERHLGSKTILITPEGEEEVALELQAAFCLSDNQLSQLAELGRQVEQFYGAPRDIEWAWADGRFHLLQARPITVRAAPNRDAIRKDCIASLGSKTDPRGTVWVRYNLSEVLPEPKPLTWAVVARLLSADGGFGAMNRDLGARPDPSLGAESAFDLVAGRPMCNLSRLPRLQFANPLFVYPFSRLKAQPTTALDPKPVFRPFHQGVSGFLRLPGQFLQMKRMRSATVKQAESFADEFESRIAPAFSEEAAAALAADWSSYSPTQLKYLFDSWIQKTLVEFARHSLKPTVFADLCWNTLVERFEVKMGRERARQAVGELALGTKPPEGANLAEGVAAFASGTLDRTTFLERFGHRCRNEMELAQPRWSEDEEAVDQLAANTIPTKTESVDPWPRIGREAKMIGPSLADTTLWVNRLRRYLGLREAGKHHLLRGYAVIRRVAVELGKRFAIGNGIFHLHPDQFDDLMDGRDFTALIAERRQRRQVELSLEVPAVLFSDDLDAIGRPQPVPQGAMEFTGIPLSIGIAEAPALVLKDPTIAPPADPYILVCPSTDPAWVPLFVRAKGLVMETGGVLSHGAIVAREFGLPAIAGLPGITRQLQTGQRLRVDGGTGSLLRLS